MWSLWVIWRDAVFRKCPVFCLMWTIKSKNQVIFRKCIVILHNDICQIKKCLGRLLTEFVYNNICNPQYIIYIIMYLLPIGLLFHHTIKSPLHILFFILILFGRLGNKIKHILAANIQQESPHIRPSCPISVLTKSKRDSHRTTVSFGEGILLLLWGVAKTI